MSAIKFKSPVETVNNWIIVRLPSNASDQLPSRGQVMVQGSLNGSHFMAALEPDGKGGHWLHIDEALQKLLHSIKGTLVELELESTKVWPEPFVPIDVQKGIVDNPETHDVWVQVTPMARWEWIRWINATANPSTRAKRITVSCSKLINGLRRPCCFNRNMCCVPQVSKNGILL